jgi:RNA polymerase sigma-70 factor (ECF subfamily)
VRFGCPERDLDVNVQTAAARPLDLRYEEVFEAHWDTVVRFALAWTNDPAAAEDLAQEAFTRLWSHRDGLDWDRPVLPWLLVTTRRLGTDRFRRLSRRLLPPPRLLADEGIRARWIDVRAAMAGLSPLERAALVLTTLQGLPSADAAEALGTSAGAIRAAVSRARDKLESA